MAKKLMALVLAVLMAVSLLPAAAFAADDLSVFSGSGSYTLSSDFEPTAPLTVTGDTTIDLNGKNLTFLSSSAEESNLTAIIIEKGTLVLKGKGTVDMSAVATGVLLSAKDTALIVSDEVTLIGKDTAIKTSAGASDVSITVNTAGTISAENAIVITDDSAKLEITTGTVSGKTAAIAYGDDVTAKPAEDILAEGSELYIDGTRVEDLTAAPNAQTLVIDDGKAPVLTVSAAVRTAETEGSIVFTASKAGTYFYRIGGEAPADAAALIADESVKSGELSRGENTLALAELPADGFTVYFAARDALGNTGAPVTASVPALLPAPTSPVWDGANTRWNAVEGASGYLLQLYLDGAVCGEAISIKDGTESGDLSGVMTTDGVYSFKVRAVGENTVGAWSAEAGEHTVDTAAPVISAGAAERTAQNAASVPFTSTETGTLYYVLNDDAADVFSSESTMAVAVGENKLSLTLSGADAASVRFGAKDAAGNASDVITVAIPLYLSAPANPVWDGTTAKWDAVEGASGYLVQLMKDGKESGAPVSAAADTLSHAFAPDTTGVYTFTVQAVNGDIKSAASAVSGELSVDKTAPEITGESASRTAASGGSVTFSSSEAGKVFYIVGGETPAQDALLASANTKDMVAGETTIELSELGADAVNVYFLVVDAAGNASGIKTVTVPVHLARPATITWFNNTTTAMWNAVSGAEAYNIQLLRDGSDHGSVIVVNGGAVTTADLASHMTEDGVYTFRVQATATKAQSEWSDVSATSYRRDTQKPTVSGHPSRRIDAKTAEFSFTASESGTYYYMVGIVGGGVPTPDQVADDKNPHGGCTNVKTTIKLTDIADTNARKVYVVVRDTSGNLSEKVYTIDIPAYTAQPTTTATPSPTPTASPAPTTYTVTLQGGTGYSIAATGGSKSPVTAGGSFSFTVTPSSGYTRGTGFAVKANGTTLTSNNGVYTISNIGANQTVSVSGIVKSQTSGGTLPAAPAITTTALAAATMGKEYRQQIIATGGTPITWSYSGTLPDGMTLAADTGILSGTPTQEGSFRFAVKATNSTGFSTRQMTLVVAGSEYTVTLGANSEWTQGGEKGIDFSGSGKGTFTVKVDGAAVAAGKYTVSSDGSTATLKPEYLDTLAAGSHTVTLVYSDGSAKAKFTIKAKDKTVAPAITMQPASAEVAEDGSATFSVTASGTTPLLCQWQVDKGDGSGWTDISGAVNASYTVETVTAEQSGWKYRCVVKNAAGSVESNAAALTVKEALGEVTKTDTESNGSGSLGRVLLITGIVVAVLALGAGLFFYFRRRSSARYMD